MNMTRAGSPRRKSKVSTSKIPRSSAQNTLERGALATRGETLFGSGGGCYAGLGKIQKRPGSFHDRSHRLAHLRVARSFGRNLADVAGVVDVDKGAVGASENDFHTLGLLVGNGYQHTVLNYFQSVAFVHA